MKLQSIKNDPVYQKNSERFGKNQVIKDPYFRYYRILKSLESRKIDINNKKTIDIGCLRPELSSLLKNIYNCEVSGVDQWEMMEEWNNYIEMEYFKHDLSKPWDKVINKKFDVIFALEIIEHMIDTDAFLDEIKKVSHENTVIIFSTPNINSLRNRLLVPFGVYPAGLEFRNQIHHVRLYNPSVLKKHLTDKGFNVFHTAGVNFIPYKFIKYKFFRILSEKLANLFPSLCPNFMVFAKVKIKKII